MRKAFIVSCFDEYNYRNKYVEQYLIQNGFEVYSFISDFHHQRKEYIRKSLRSNVELIHTPPYTSNYSLKRIINHYVFAKKMVKIIRSAKPDFVYANIPPNFVSWCLGRLRKKSIIPKLAFDIYDLWPETMTFGKTSILLRPFFVLWQRIRNKYINQADINITACKLHENVLYNQGVDKMHTLYLLKAHSILVKDIPKQDSISEIRLCYIGTVNNIIDIDTICNVIKAIKNYKPIKLLFIGIGETKQEFLERVTKIGCSVIDYGVVYDEIEKERIMLSCHFGINIMKPQVCVGVTLKSLEYFSCGLPILNTIAGDTKSLVDEYCCGYNID
ncbi:MAG: hypothetical protein IKO36_09840, partial [Bacteroidaceae bacterium]|nr:hypothetical protein [Bacteroidaceae bacterium]